MPSALHCGDDAVTWSRDFVYLFACARGIRCDSDLPDVHTADHAKPHLLGAMAQRRPADQGNVIGSNEGVGWD